MRKRIRGRIVSMDWEAIKDFLEHKLYQNITPGLILQAVLFTVGVVLGSKLVRSITIKALKNVPHLDSGTRNAIATVVYYIVLAVGLGMVIGSLGLSSSSLAVFTGALGLGIGLGFQDVAKNFISGLIMLIGKTIKPEDIITVGEMTGRVEVVGMYSSTMRTVQDATVIIPNSEILSSKFINWTHDNRIRMIEIPVGVHYDSDMEVVQECLRDAAKNLEKVLEDPPVRVLLVNYGESSVDFVARIWTDEVFYYQRVISAYYLEVWRLFKDRGVIIPYPQRDLHIHTVPSELVQK
ncbi:MAG: mechanosensitive ion channel [Armatimonadetes bacterium]|nr:mechanosensitive ion channel [Armatimonadota bacterium]